MLDTSIKQQLIEHSTSPTLRLMDRYLKFIQYCSTIQVGRTFKEYGIIKIERNTNV